MKTNIHCAIIGDIIESKKITDRAEVQRTLNKSLSDINKKYGQSISSCFLITLGDEFQGLLNNVDSLMEIIDDIKDSLYPVRIRFGVGIGQLQTEVTDLAIGADGPAYHKAREAMDQLKQSEAKNEQPTRNIMLNIDDKYGHYIRLTNASLSICAVMESSWTKKQREIISLARTGIISQKQLAAELNISESAVNRRLKSTNFFNYQYLKQSIQMAISDIWRQLNAE